MAWTDDEKQTALLMGLDTIFGELLEDHGWQAHELDDRCSDSIASIADEIAAEREGEGVD
jgi:hypothetical protein